MCIGAMIISLGKTLEKVEINSILVHLLSIFYSNSTESLFHFVVRDGTESVYFLYISQLL